MAKLPSLVVGVIGVGGAAALFAVSLRPSGGGVSFDPVAAAIDGAVRETGAAVHSRVTTLAELPKLAAAVATDATTVRDLTQDELAFRPRAGETITIGQVPKGGAPSVLLQIPEGGGTKVTLDRAGLRLSVDGKSAFVTEVVMVRPRDHADDLSGAIAVSLPVDLKSVQAQLDALGGAARLEAEGGALALGKPIPEGATPTSLALSGDASKGAKLIVAPAQIAGPNRGVQAAAGAMALWSLIGAALLWRRKPKVSGPDSRPAFRPTDPATKLSSAEVRKSLVVSAVDADGQVAGGGGQSIGRYSILKRLGAGGMADVYLARATGEAGFEKLVALKVMHKHLAAQPIIVEHFLDEARLASRLTHPNIVQIIDLGRASDEYFIAMEYIEGADLHRLMASARANHRPVPPRVGMTILRKICDGLAFAHSASGTDGKPLDLVHRDVKAANVFVDKNGAVKVGDFGIAKANQNMRNKTEVGQVKGTAAYMAPEHRLGETVDLRADIFAVGAIAYELLTGNEINLDLVRLAHLGRQGWPHLPHLAEARPELPAELEPVIWKALAYDKADRQATCAEIEEQLDAIATKYGLIASDKVVAAWVEGELSTMTPKEQVG